MNQIVILGKLNADVVQLIRDIPDWEVHGFLDDVAAPDERVLGFPVLGPLDRARDMDNVAFVMSIVSNPKATRDILARLDLPANRFPNLIHPAAHVFRDAEGEARLGHGNLILQGCSVQPGAILGDFNYLNINTVIGHDASLGNWNSFGVGAVVTGYCSVGDACYIGSGSVIADRSEVGDECFVCAATLVPRSLKPQSKVMGSLPRKLPTP